MLFSLSVEMKLSLLIYLGTVYSNQAASICTLLQLVFSLYTHQARHLIIIYIHDRYPIKDSP